MQKICTAPLETYKNIEKNSTNYNTIVMGPWSHGDWARNKERQAIGNVYFGDNISAFYQEEIETTFFTHFLKGSADGTTNLPEAYMYDTGKNAWSTFENWPPLNAAKEDVSSS